MRITRSGFASAWRAVVTVATVGGLAVVASGCADSAGETSVAPVTVTVTASPSASGYSAVPSASESRSPRPSQSYAGLASSFASVASSTGPAVGIAIAPVGGSAVPTLTLGDPMPRVAWSTIKVPLAVAAERANGVSTAASAAIISSDNGSAEALWQSLGGGQEAAAAVTAVLREGGDTTTVVPATARRPGYTIFGQTVWALPDAATFTANLPCMPGTRNVLALMGQVAGNQQWGVEVMPAPRATAVKGGWGPGVSEGYLVRQIGLITFGDGRRTAVAMSAVGGSMSDGISALNTVAAWLNRSMAALPKGRCAG